MQNLPKIERASGPVAALTTDDPLFDESQTAEYMGDISPRTLQRWRHEGRGPAYYVLGRLVRYRRSQLDRYIESSIRNSRIVAKDIAASASCTSPKAQEKAFPVNDASPKGAQCRDGEPAAESLALDAPRSKTSGVVVK